MDLRTINIRIILSLSGFYNIDSIGDIDDRHFRVHQHALRHFNSAVRHISNIVFPGHPLKELAEIARAHIRVLRRLIQADPPPDIPVNVIQNLLLAVYLVQPALLYGRWEIIYCY